MTDNQQQESQQAVVLDDVDVTIVGGGMVGVAIACAIAPQGMKIRVLESRNGDPQGLIDALPALSEQGYDPRVSALTAASQALLTRVGAWPAMQQARIKPYTGMRVWDGMGNGTIDFDADALHEPCLGHIVENRVTLAALYQVMRSFDNIDFLAGANIDSLGKPDSQGRRQLRLNNGERFMTDLVVAADGAHSKTRQLLDMGAVEWDYGHHAIVTTVTTEQSHQNCCWQRFTEDGPLAFLPLANDDTQTASIVWSTSPDHARELMALDNEAFCSALAKAFDQRLGTVTSTDKRYVVPLRQRHAKSYIEKGVALAGDAAHTIHPLAGQGVNLGFLDAAALAEVIIDAYSQKQALGSDTVLHRYQRMRRADNIKTAAAMEAFRRLFVKLPIPLRIMRSQGMNLFNRLTPVKLHMVLMAMGLRGEVPKLARREVA